MLLVDHVRRSCQVCVFSLFGLVLLQWTETPCENHFVTKYYYYRFLICQTIWMARDKCQNSTYCFWPGLHAFLYYLLQKTHKKWLPVFKSKISSLCCDGDDNHCDCLQVYNRRWSLFWKYLPCPSVHFYSTGI